VNAFRSVLMLCGALALAACSAQPGADVAGPLLSKSGTTDGGTTTPAIDPDLTGHWKQTNPIHVTTTLGTTDYWFEFDALQSGGTLTGKAVQHMNTFNVDGSPWLVDFTGSPGKLSGVVKTDSTATITFNKINETKVTMSYKVKLSADGVLVVLNPTANGPVSFVR
jgi:hypothetical protein